MGNFFSEWVGGPLARFFAWTMSIWPPVKRGGAILIIAVFIGLIAYSAYVNTLDPTGFGLLDQDDRAFWTKFGPISALVLVLMKSLWTAVKSDGSLQHIVVSDYDKTDMKQMARYMASADAVFIYSGDFSYVYDYQPLYNALHDLAARGNLALISYKSETTVLTQSEARRGEHECIVQRLIDDSKVSFDVPGRTKFSLVYKRGEEVLLYRHREAETEYVTVFKANNAPTKQLVETVRTLLNTVIAAHPPK